MKKYSTFDGLSCRFNQDVQIALLNNTEIAYLSEAPTIGLVSEVFGSDNASLWVKTQILTIDFYNGTSKVGDYDAIGEASRLFVREYGYIKLTEFLLFVARFKLGIYGKFYGSFDLITLGKAFKEFLRDKQKEILNIERAKTLNYGSNWFKPPTGYSSLTWIQELRQRAMEGDKDAIEQLGPYWNKKTVQGKG